MATRIAAIAETQWGVVRHSDFGDLGVRRPLVKRWTEIGHLHRPYRGVYTLTPLSTLAP